MEEPGRRQDNVSLSTSEAEFVAASQAGQEAIFVKPSKILVTNNSKQLKFMRIIWHVLL